MNRRLRLLLAAAVLVLVGGLGMARPAGAEGSGEYKDKAAEECAHLLSEGKTVEDCQESPNPLVPATNELVFGFIGWAIVFGLLAWKGVPAMKKGMQARSDRIKADLDSAEAQRTEASEILEQYKAQLADARSESARIIEEARQAADSVRSDLQAKAEADIAELRTRANADIESAKAQAIADLRGEVTALAIGAAEQVVGRNLDQETNAALVEAYINSVGAR